MDSIAIEKYAFDVAYARKIGDNARAQLKFNEFLDTLNGKTDEEMKEMNIIFNKECQRCMNN